MGQLQDQEPSTPSSTETRQQSSRGATTSGRVTSPTEFAGSARHQCPLLPSPHNLHAVGLGRVAPHALPTCVRLCYPPCSYPTYTVPWPHLHHYLVHDIPPHTLQHLHPQQPGGLAFCRALRSTGLLSTLLMVCSMLPHRSS